MTDIDKSAVIAASESFAYWVQQRAEAFADVAEKDAALRQAREAWDRANELAGNAQIELIRASAGAQLDAESTMQKADYIARSTP